MSENIQTVSGKELPYGDKIYKLLEVLVLHCLDHGTTLQDLIQRVRQSREAWQFVVKTETYEESEQVLQQFADRLGSAVTIGPTDTSVSYTYVKHGEVVTDEFTIATDDIYDLLDHLRLRSEQEYDPRLTPEQ